MALCQVGAQCLVPPCARLLARGFISILHACNWALATAGSWDTNDMLIHKLGSNSSLVLGGTGCPASHPAWGPFTIVSFIHHGVLYPPWGPAFTTGFCTPPTPGSYIHHGMVIHPPRGPTSTTGSCISPTVGSCIQHRVPHPTSLLCPSPTLPHPRGTVIPTSLPRICSSVSCTSMRGLTVVKSFHQGQSFTPLFFLMFFCTQRMAKSWICTGARRQVWDTTGRLGCVGAQHPGTLPFIIKQANCPWLIYPIASSTEVLQRCLFYAAFNYKVGAGTAAPSRHRGAAPSPQPHSRPHSRPHNSPQLSGGGRGRCWARRQQKGCAAHFRRNCVQRSGEGRSTTNLPLLEVLPCQEAPARRLEQGDVPAGLRVPLLLQPGQ